MGTPTVKCGPINVAHNDSVWVVKTNRHTSTAGNRWGWIDGAPGNVCWSNDDRSFTHADACAAAEEHNRWLEAQTPIEIRIIVARQHVLDAYRKWIKAKKRADTLAEEWDRACAELSLLESKRDATSC